MSDIKQAIEDFAAHYSRVQKAIGSNVVSLHAKLQPHEILELWPDATRCRQPSKDQGIVKLFAIAMVGDVMIWSEGRKAPATAAELSGPSHLEGWA